ncbi:MAG: glycosyltransferase family 39 protein [Burkholderiales bacterium]|nr:glycosyltransferase family 39 protein [Burkholderiales bacterium]
MRRIRSFAAVDKMFVFALTISLGIGLHILGLQVLGALGLLTKSYVATLLSLGFIGFASNFIFRSRFSEQALVPVRAKQHWFFPALICVLAIELFAKPLRPATGWDELMYHLPHAREWASAGKLTINEWLRYPLFPYNFNLLYAESLIFGNETFPHMVHAFAGCLVAFGIYRLALNYFDGVIASITVFLFVILALGQFGTAYVDLGLCLFIFFGISCLFFWYEKKDNGYIYVAMFLLGIAAGIKYQALIFTPFFAVAILLRERRPTRLLLMMALFLIPCIYWYVRNYFISGDPFHPLGAKLFGYWGWNAKDMEAQFADIKRVADWPNWCVWPALGAIFMRSKMNYFPFRAALLISIYSFFVWMFTSHYSRYLLPAYPFIALLSAVVLRSIYQKLVLNGGKLSEKSRKTFMLENGLASVILGLLLILVIPSFAKHWKKVQVSSNERSAYLRRCIRARSL